MTKSIRWKVVFAVAITAFTIFSFSLAHRSLVSVERCLPHSASILASDGIGISLEQAMLLETSSIIETGALGLATSMFFRANDKVEVVAAIPITPGAIKLLPLEYIEGGFDGNYVSFALVSDELASGFGLTQGDQIELDEAEYIVCGIYRQKRSIAESIAGDGRARVYIYSKNLLAETPVAELLITDEWGADAQQLARTAMRITQTQLIGQYRDYRMWVELAHGLMQLAYLLCYIILVALILWFAGKQIIYSVEHLNEATSLRVARGLIAVALATGVFIGLSIQMHALRIPGRYLPPDNVFSISHYLTQITAFMRNLHMTPYYYDWIYILHLSSMLLFAALGIALFCVVMISICRLIRALAIGKRQKRF